MNHFNKYIIASLACSSLLLTACSSANKEPVYGDNTIVESDIETKPYESCLEIISPKAYSDSDGLNITPSSVISMITPTSSTPYWDTIKSGAFQAIEDINTSLGYSGKDKITLSFNTASTVDDEINILDSELSRYPAAIALAPLDNIAFGMQFDQAMENGIPIITFENATTNNNVSAVVSTDNDIATLTLVDHFQNLSESASNYIIITSDATSWANSLRVNSALSLLDKSNLKGDFKNTVDLSNLSQYHELMYIEESATETSVDITSEDSHSKDLEVNESYPPYDYSTEETIAFLLNYYSDVDNILILDGDAGETIINIFKDMEVNFDNYNILCFDTSSVLTDALREGQLDGLLISNPYGIGYAAIIASVRASLDMGNEASINTGHILLDSTTVDNELNQDFLY